jgi:hypothetical protein
MPWLLVFGPIHCTAVPVNGTDMLSPATLENDSVFL